MKDAGGGGAILYCATIDADCFAARLLLAVLGREYEAVPVDAYPGLDESSRQMLKAGPLPILEDDGELLAGLRAVFEHLTGASPWLDFACDELSGLKDLRQRALTGDPPTEAELSEARRTLLVLEDELTVIRLRGGRWFADAKPGAEPAGADLALYPAVALSRDVGLEHDEFPALRHWLRDVRALAPAVHMPGVLDPI